MRKYILALVGIVMSLNMISQTPQGFKYQAIVRDNSGNLLAEQSVNFIIEILSGTVDGPVVYSESHVATSNLYGLVSLENGSGTTTDDFTAINWGEELHFLTLWINLIPIGCSSKKFLDIQCLLIVGGNFTLEKSIIISSLLAYPKFLFFYNCRSNQMENFLFFVTFQSILISRFLKIRTLNRGFASVCV